MSDLYINGFLRDRFHMSGYVVTDGGSCGNPNCEATVAAANSSIGTYISISVVILVGDPDSRGGGGGQFRPLAH